ncbi:MAG: efflux RND transporter periplasmic adaptor subunit [bacterium]
MTVLLMCGCEKKKTAMAGAQEEVGVSEVVVQPKNVPLRIERVAQTASSREVSIVARVEGYLINRAYTEGDEVKEGELLFEIDHKPFMASLEEAQGRRTQAQAQLKLAEIELARNQQLVKTNVAAQNDLDKAIASYETARGNMQLQDGAVINAGLNLSYTSITSPLKGRAGKANFEVGSYVGGPQNIVLAQAVQTDPMYVYFFVSEADLLKMREGVKSNRYSSSNKGELRVKLTLSDGADYPNEGKLNFFDIKINPQTGTAMVRAEVPNPDDLLLPGEYVKVHLIGIEQLHTLAVPQRAVIQNAGGQFLAVIGPGEKVDFRPVVMGNWTGDNWIIDKGLKPGDRVIVDGTTKIKPGIRVKATLLVTDAATTPTAHASAVTTAPQAK